MSNTQQTTPAAAPKTSSKTKAAKAQPTAPAPEASAPEQPKAPKVRPAPDAAKVEAIKAELEAAKVAQPDAGTCAVIRSVAANHLADKPEFVAAAVAVGYNRITAGVQFGHVKNKGA